MISLMVATLVCSVCIVNRECKEWEQIVADTQKGESTEETDKIVEDEEIKVESDTESIKQEVDNDIEVTTPSVEIEVNSSTGVSSDYSNCDVPNNNTIKSYMDYKHITSPDSRQYKLQHSLAYTGNYGIRMVGDRYCVAVGSYYATTIGQYIDIELENGNVIKAILADCKNDAHTDATNKINPNGSVIEFVVDTGVLDDTAKIMGDISYINGWDSKVINIKVYNEVEEF